MTSPEPELMYDGINALAAGIARDFPAVTRVAGYIDGIYAWRAAHWALFPHADKVKISVIASLKQGDVLDVENGDALPDQVEGWIAARKADGLYRPTIYCNRSTIPAVRTATGKYVLGVDYDIWVADYTGSAHQVTAPGSPAATCAATQYESTASYDVSMVYDEDWPHRNVPGPPVPPPPPVAESLTQSATGHTTRAIDVYRSGGKDYTGNYSTVVKTLTGKAVASDTGKDTHVTLTVPGRGIYVVTTAALGCKPASRRVIVL